MFAVGGRSHARAEIGFGGDHRVDVGDHREPAADAAHLQLVQGGGAPPHQIACHRVAPLGIRVNALAPGYVKTEMAPVDRARSPAVLDRRRAPAVLRAAAAAALRAAREGRPQRRLPGQRRGLVHHRLGARGRWGVHRMVSSTAPGVNRRVVVNALDDVIVEAVPDRLGLRSHRECHVLFRSCNR